MVVLFSLSCIGKGQPMEHKMLTIDHVLIAVDNLDSAKSEYESYGFTVVYGGDKDKALNALIFLKDGTLIELIGKDRFPSSYKTLNKLRITRLFGFMKDRISAFSSVPAGFFNYSLYSPDLNHTYNYFKSTKIKVSKPKAFERKREDGTIVRWELIGTKPYDLPFIIGDYTPGRVSDSSFLNHKNHAVGIDSILIETSVFAEYYEIYNLLYSQKPLITHDTLQKAVYKVKNITVVLSEARLKTKYFGRNDKSAPVALSVRCSTPDTGYSFRLNNFLR